LEGKLRPGQRVIVRGTESTESEGGRDRRVVFQVSRAGEGQAAVVCPIRVCAKKNCWRSGGKELWRELERRIADAGLEDTVKLKAVNCLDRCKHGPNVDIPGCEFTRCSPRGAEEILARFTQGVKSNVSPIGRWRDGAMAGANTNSINS
jgi:hypothetical protein